MSDRNPSAGSDDAYVSHRFDAPPETVFAAWTDPEQVARWWAPRGFEIPPESVDIEPRVGGRFHLDMVEVSGPGRFRYRAEIVELVEPELLALKGEPIDGTDIEVTITRVELVAEGGGTRMTVTSGPFTREARENAQTGWGELVVNLERVLAAGPARRELEAFYLRYHRCCNEHAFERLDEFVADDVEINGERRGLQGYVDSLEEVVRAFPDFRWELRHLVIDGSWIAAHLLDEGTHPDGRVVTTHEFAVYRVAAGKIAEVWGDLRTAELIART